MKFESKLIHGGFDHDEQTGATRVPIYQSAAFAHDTAQSLEDTFNGRKYGHFYSRVSNPTIAAFEQRVTTLEDGKGALATASGMAAITTLIFALCKSGDNIVSSASIFGSTYYLLNSVITQAGIEVRFVDPTDIKAVDAAIDEKTQFVFVEVLGNPRINVPNLADLTQVTKSHGVPFVLDNTFLSPYLVNAKEIGVAITVQATTKYLCGGGTAIGGIVVDLGNYDWKQSKSEVLEPMVKQFGELGFVSMLKKVRANTGACQSPQNAFYSMLGLDTLHLRMDRHCENAVALATFLEKHGSVESVTYPGLKSHPEFALAKEQFKNRFGGMLNFRLGSKEKAYAFIDKVKMAKNLVNLGDAKTLVVAPRFTIYRNFSNDEAQKAGVYDDMVRVSVGLEHIDDIIEDFERALT